MNFQEKKIKETFIHIGDGNYSSKYPKASEFLESGVPFFSASDFKNGRLSKKQVKHISPEQHKTLKKGHIKENDVLIVTRGNGIGKVALVDKEYEGSNINAQLALLRADEKELHSIFLYYLLSSLEYYEVLKNFGSGSAQPQLTITSLQSVPLRFPDYKDQIKIAQILRTIDSKVFNNLKTNEVLENLAQTIFNSWFVDFDPVHAKKLALETGLNPEQAERAAMAIISGVCSPSNFTEKFEEMDKRLSKKLSKMSQEKQEELARTASLFPSEFEDSEIGEIPKGWCIEALGNIVNRLKPKGKYTKKNIATRGKTIVYEQGAGLIFGYTDEEPDFKCSANEPKFIFGDHTCVMKLSAQDFSISANVIPLEGKKFPTSWIYYACLGRQKFEEYRRHWSEFIVKKTVLPCVALPKVFSDIQSTFQEKIEQNVAENNYLEDLRDTLLPKLLAGAGEVDLSNIEIGDDL